MTEERKGKIILLVHLQGKLQYLEVWKEAEKYFCTEIVAEVRHELLYLVHE